MNIDEIQRHLREITLDEIQYHIGELGRLRSELIAYRGGEQPDGEEFAARYPEH